MSLFIGFAFPFRKGATSFPETATDDALIKQSLIQLILTGRGERVMRPDVGSGAYSYVFEDNDDILASRVSNEITAVVQKYEPRVALLGVEVVRGDPNIESEASSITVTVNYVVLLSSTLGTLTINLSSGGP